MTIAEELKQMRDDAQFNDIVALIKKTIKEKKQNATHIDYMGVTEHTGRKLSNEGFKVEAVSFQGYKTTRIFI